MSNQDCSTSQRDVNTMYLQFHIADGQEESYVEEYVELTVESSKPWFDQWQPTLNVEEIEQIAWSLSDMGDGNDKCKNIDKILDVLRPHVKHFKAYLAEEWGGDFGYERASDLDLDEFQF